jgi:hypothetical protein
VVRIGDGGEDGAGGRQTGGGHVGVETLFIPSVRTVVRAAVHGGRHVVVQRRRRGFLDYYVSGEAAGRQEYGVIVSVRHRGERGSEEDYDFQFHTGE